MRIVEFFYFYLMPETPRGVGAGDAGNLQRSPSKRLGNGGAGSRNGETRTTEDKQMLLGRYLNNVEDLVEDLRDTSFGAVLS